MSENHPVIEMLEALRAGKELSPKQRDLLESIYGPVDDVITLDNLHYYGSFKSGVLVHEWGGEGEGDSIGYVLKVGEEFFKVCGSYNSWDGADYDWATIFQVEPRQVMRTEYVAI